jgi:dihydrofolate synthase/folylpolyglutamate synthase
MGFYAATAAVVGMLGDKDIPGVLRALVARVERWYACSLSGPRGAAATTLADRLRELGVPTGAIVTAATPEAAFAAAHEAAGADDRIVVFGSFLTVAAVLPMARASVAAVKPRDG